MDHEICVEVTFQFDMYLSKEGIVIVDGTGPLLKAPLSDLDVFLNADVDDSCEASRAKVLAELDALRKRVEEWRY